MAYLATHDYLEDKSFVDKWLYTMRTGEMDLSWMNANTEKVATRPQNARRGLTYRDLDVGTYGFTGVPEKVRENRSYAPRGAEIPEGVPDAQPWVSRKSELWAFNTESYYEEAVSRQWNATTDIPWDRLDGVELARQVEKLLDRFHEAVEFVVTVGIVVNNFQTLAEMRERVDVVRGVGLAVAPDVLDHLTPHARVAFDFEIDLL